MLLRLPIWNQPSADELFDDDQAWILPSEEQYDVSAPGKLESRRGDDNGMEMPVVRNYKDQHEH